MLKKIIFVFFASIVLLIFLLNINRTLIFLGERLCYWYYQPYKLLAISLLVVIFITVWKRIHIKWNNKIFWITFLGIHLIFFIIKIHYLYSFCLMPTTDQAMVYSHTIEILNGNLQSLEFGNYMNLLKNQFSLFILFSNIMKVIGTSEYALYWFNATIISLSTLFLSLIAWKLKGESTAIITSIGINFFFPLTFLGAVVYGDSIQLFLTSLCLLIYILNIPPLVKYSIIAALSSISYMARPVTIVFVIAILIMIVFFENHPVKQKIIYSMITVCLFILPNQLLVQGYTKYYDVDFQSLGINQYIMIGTGYSNYGTAGAYNSKSLNYFKATKDIEKTNDFINNEIKQQLNYLSKPNHFVHFIKEKLYYTWTDPDFETLNFVFPNDFHTPENQLIKNFENTGQILGYGFEHFFYTNDFGDFIYHNWKKIRHIEKIYYFCALLSGIILSFKKKVYKSNMNLMLMMMFIGYFLLQLILETKPRYALIYFVFYLLFIFLNCKEIHFKELINRFKVSAK